MFRAVALLSPGTYLNFVNLFKGPVPEERYDIGLELLARPLFSMSMCTSMRCLLVPTPSNIEVESTVSCFRCCWTTSIILLILFFASYRSSSNPRPPASRTRNLLINRLSIDLQGEKLFVNRLISAVSKNSPCASCEEIGLVYAYQ